MLIWLWIVSFMTAFFSRSPWFIFYLLHAKQPRPFHQACELTVYTTCIYPLSLAVTAAFILTMMLLYPFIGRANGKMTYVMHQKLLLINDTM